MRHLKNRVIIVTGAASGFGRLISLKCAAGGAKVVAVDVDEQNLSTLVTEICAARGRATSIVASVVELSEVEAAIRHAVQTFGTIDVIVNNAGVMPLAYFADHRQAIGRWHQAIDINIKGVLNGMCAVYDQMIAQGRGHIVNISSIYGNAGVEGAAVYSATKAAVGILSDSLRIEAQGKIKVSTVRPTGVLGTNLHRSMVDGRAVKGLVGQRIKSYAQRYAQLGQDELPPQLSDPNSVQYWLITPDDLTDAVVHVIDQPWGVNISDITVRASGEDYVY